MASAAALLPSPSRVLPHPPSLLAPLSPMRAALHLRFPHRRRPPFLVLASTTSTWSPATVTSVSPATPDLSLYHVAVDAPALAASYTTPGQYLQLRVKGADGVKPAFLAIASPPGRDREMGLEFLIKKVPRTTAELVCQLGDRDVVELGSVMGKGFNLESIASPGDADSVLIFATGSGISAIRSLVEFGFDANMRSDVRLYYGARNLQSMAYQDRFKSWESTGIKIISVLSQPDDTWKGESGYVQHAFLKAKRVSSPSSTGAVLCGHKQMLEEITASLEADGVSRDKILKNF